MELSRDDWELTLKQCKSQAVQLQLQTSANDAVMLMVATKLQKLPKKEQPANEDTPE